MEDVCNKLRQVIGELFDIEAEPAVTVAPAETGADFASNVAMQLSKTLHKAPREIAEEIVKKWDDSAFSVEIAGPGFLNFTSSDEYFVQQVADLSQNFTKNISLDAYSGQTVICEFSDPNPFKVLHVGHLYTSIVGDAISRLAEFAGAKVVRANFGGDVGLHVAKNLWALEKSQTGLPADAPAAEIAEILAKNYVEGTRAYEEDETAKAEITALNKEIYQIAEADKHDTKLAQLYWAGREASYRYFKDFYARLGVTFDKYYPESTVAERGLKEVKSHPEVYTESAGALVFKGEDYGLHTRVFVNKEGLPTYEAKDVGLLFTKWDDYHFDKSIVITGNEITDYMKVVLTSVKQYAPELVERTLHLTHGMVKLPGMEKMSSRKGNFLRATDVLDAVTAALPAGTDERVMLSATKYALLRYKIGGDIEFDIKSSVATTGNSGVYLLYSLVRAKKILAKTTISGVVNDLDSAEKALAQKLLQYREVLAVAVRELAPHRLCQYLYELAQEFSRFYEKSQVVGGEREAERICLVALFAKVLEHGLNLLGCECPEEM